MRLRSFNIAVSAFVIGMVLSNASYGAAAGKNPYRFRKVDVADARYGVGNRQLLLEKAYGLSKKIDSVVYGQEIASKLVQSRVTQYLENYGTRTGEPVALHLIGLPGVGKSAIVKKLIAEGFPVVHFDAQAYAASDNSGSFGRDVRNQLSVYTKEQIPVILVVEEIDKLPEIVPGVEKQETHPLIGQLNQILSEGRLTVGGTTLDFSNVMVMTTMNFSPQEIESFSLDSVGETKSYYDYTFEDFKKFDQWVRMNPSATYKTLSRLFRSNTVSRLAEDTIIMQPLGSDEHRAIVEQVVQSSVLRSTTGPNENKKMTIEIDPSTIDFLSSAAIFAPGGGRATVKKTDALIEQLINLGMKARDPNERTEDRPRKMRIGIDSKTHNAILTITPLIYRPTGLVEGKSFQVIAPYEPGARQFLQPSEQLVVMKPAYPPGKEPLKPEDKPVTKKEMLAARFPKYETKAEGLEDAIGKNIFGQSDTIAVLKDDLNRYLSRVGPAKKEPSLRAISGFPGIGKSEIVKIAGRTLGLPIVKVNMQQFSADSTESVAMFLSALNSGIEAAKAASKDGRYILLIEELDKIFEKDPQTGGIVNRPVMAVVKDLLNEGQASGHDHHNNEIALDVRDAMVFVTMNFAVDRFGFTADPRMTSIDDVLKAWRSLKSTPMNIKSLLGSMFLPETVNRLMARLTIMKPVDAPSYAKIIDAQVRNVIDERLHDQYGRNVGQIEVELSPAYRKYLFSESVIPSEGARNTVVDAQKMISRDLNLALGQLPRNSRYAKKPVVLTLDFNAAKAEVRGSIRLQEAKNEKPDSIFSVPTDLKFPSPRIQGRIPEKRLKTSAHEFGHAFAAILLGLRIEHVVVIPPNTEAGGYVKFKGERMSAPDLMADVYSTVASRAMERMVMSKDPLDPRSTMDITAGPSQDIKQATMTLYNMLYELGFDPFGGTVDRNFMMGGGKYAAYQELPPELAGQLGLVLRDMENFVLEDLLKRHDRQWYVEKIVKVARAGAVTEKEFYSIIDYAQPEEAPRSFGTVSQLKKMFARYVERDSRERVKAMRAKHGNNKRTTVQNMEDYMKAFMRSVVVRLHPELAPQPALVKNPIGFHSPVATKKQVTCQEIFQ